MKRVGVTVVIGFVLTSFVSANPLLMQAGKRAISKKVLIKGVKNGKMILHNLNSGKIKAVRFKKLGKYIRMPSGKRGALTSHGYVRNSKKFWQAFKKKYPKTLSRRNSLRIHNGKSPVVDSVWARHFKHHKPFNGQKLEHHHMGKGAFAVPLPKGMHRGAGNSGFWHKHK